MDYKWVVMHGIAEKLEELFLLAAASLGIDQSITVPFILNVVEFHWIVANKHLISNLGERLNTRCGIGMDKRIQGIVISGLRVGVATRTLVDGMLEYSSGIDHILTFFQGTVCDTGCVCNRSLGSFVFVGVTRDGVMLRYSFCRYCWRV